MPTERSRADRRRERARPAPSGPGAGEAPVQRRNTVPGARPTPVWAVRRRPGVVRAPIAVPGFVAVPPALSRPALRRVPLPVLPRLPFFVSWRSLIFVATKGPRLCGGEPGRAQRPPTSPSRCRALSPSGSAALRSPQPPARAVQSLHFISFSPKPLNKNDPGRSAVARPLLLAERAAQRFTRGTSAMPERALNVTATIRRAYAGPAASRPLRTIRPYVKFAPSKYSTLRQRPPEAPPRGRRLLSAAPPTGPRHGAALRGTTPRLTSSATATGLALLFESRRRVCFRREK